MAAAPALWAVGRDLLWCLGLGLLLGMFRSFAGLLLGNGRSLCFVWDLLSFVAAAVLLCGFAASASTGGGMRWYMAAGAGAGALAWRWAVSRTLYRLAAGGAALVTGAALRLQGVLLAPFVHLKRHFAARKQTKTAAKAKKRAEKVTKKKKQLQKPRKILYN